MKEYLLTKRKCFPRTLEIFWKIRENVLYILCDEKLAFGCNVVQFIVSIVMKVFKKEFDEINVNRWLTKCIHSILN